MAGPKAGAVEQTARRSANSKHYKNPDGSFSAIVYPVAIHYKSAPNGAWLDKDLRFAAGGTRFNEQRSYNSDVGMATWQEGSGANRRWYVEFLETLTGRGIQFELQFQPLPVVGTNELRFTDSQNRTWSYFHTRQGGKMFGPPIAVEEGPKPFSFPYRLIGGAPPLEKLLDGSVRSADASGTIFSMVPPHFRGSDGKQYRQTEWTLVPNADPTTGGTLSFEIDDTGLSAAAFPYRLDPSTSFSIASGVGTDDQHVERSGATYPPTNPVDRNTTADRVWSDRENSAGTYFVDNALLRWDTSSLSDTATLTGAALRAWVLDRADTNGLSLVAGWYAWDGTSTTDFTHTPTSDAHAGTALSAITLGADNDFTLSALENISPTGTTSLRTGITQRAADAAPTGGNYATFASLEHATQEPARLLVDYVAGPVFRSASSAGTTTAGGASLTIPVPVGVVAGDEMEALLAVSGGTGATVTPPAGWTLVGPAPTHSTTAVGLWVYRKTAEESEPADYTWNFDSARAVAGGMAAYSNSSPLPTVDDSASQANASSATVTAPTVTAHADNEKLLFAGAINSASTWTPPSGMTERLEVIGYGLGAAGAAKTFYLLDSLSGTTQFYTSQDGGSAPTDAAHSTATGWIAATNAAGQSALLDSLTEISRTSADWSATLQPSAAPSSARGDAFSTPAPLTGQFASGNWTLSMSVRSITAAYTGRFRFRWRVWASTNQNGSGARELTGSTQVTAATTANLSTTANTTLSVTWAPGSTITLDNEYVFFQLAIEITTAGTGTTTDINLRKNSAAAVTTPAWTPGIATSIMLADEDLAGTGATGTRAATASIAAVNIGHALSLNPSAVRLALAREPQALMFY